MKLLTAKPLIQEIYGDIREIIAQKGLHPFLKIIQIGQDPAASFYVSNLIKQGGKAGITVEAVVLDPGIDNRDLLEMIAALNKNPEINGVMIQKPLPAHIDEHALNMKIDPAKDVDGFHPVNIGNLILDRPGFLPSTPAAVLEMIRYYRIPVAGKHVVILGRSNIVGKPLANLFLRKNATGNATVTVCHSRSENLPAITRSADILVAAIGRPEFVKPEMVKPGVILIDVGINQVPDATGKPVYVGDIDFNGCQEKSEAITPVPGGVGSVTTALLLKNVATACLNQK